MYDLQALLTQVRQEIEEQSYEKMFQLLHNLGMSESGGVPLETLMGVLRAIADASGYRIALQAATIESLEHDPNMFRITGHREIAVVDPVLFTTPTSD